MLNCVGLKTSRMLKVKNMNDESLFIHSLNDLHKSINSEDEYEVLRASGLIRQLFLDGGISLFDKVNRTHRTKLLFEIAEYDSLKGLIPTPDIMVSFQELDPEGSPPHWIRKKLKRDDFFSFIVANIEGHEYSIRDLVKFAANIMGGIHSGASSDDKEKNLEKLKGLYIFSNINTALLFIKAVGQNILKTLMPLRNKILGIERFENAKGLSIFFAIILLPLPDKENFIHDIGIEENRNRLSIFLNSSGDLCLKYINSTGRRYLLNAGSKGFSYYQKTFLSFQVSFNETEFYLCIEDEKWKHVEIQPINSSEFSQETFDELNTVIGSNVLGKAETHMELIGLLVYSRILPENEQMQAKNTLTKDFDKKDLKVVHFEGNQPMHTPAHPNFTKINSN